jgi:ketosteroid isomerase-like protein
MSTAAWLQGVLERAFATLDFRSLAAHLADDVVFEITPPKGLPVLPERRGKQDVLAYFAGLGDIVSFWRVRCYGDGERVVVVGAESFTLPRTGLTVGGEFAFLLQICDRLITRFLIIEDLSNTSTLEAPATERA